MSVIFREQDPIRLVTSSTTIPYSISPSTFEITVSGGSGSGDYWWSIEPVTGSMITSNDQLSIHGSSTSQTFKFVEFGSVLLNVYRAGSQIGQNDFYVQSKTLQIELNLTEKEIQISASPSSKIYPFGHGYKVSDFGVSHPNTTNAEYNSALSTKPNLYAPYAVRNKEDFYRFDVFSRSKGSGYSDGVQYVDNGDGSWYIKGTPSSGTSYYNVIVSDSKMPDYLFAYSRYLYRTSATTQPIVTEIVLYFPNEVSTVTELTDDSSVALSEEACGFILRFKVTDQIDDTLSFHWYSLKDRVVDDTSDKIYHISGYGGVVADNSSTYKKYSKSLDYKSAEFKFENTTEYSINNLSSSTRYTVTGLKSSYLPKTDVIFTVKANPNYFYEDGWESSNIHPCIDLYNDNVWADWWSDEDVGICEGVGSSSIDTSYFRIRSINPYSTPAMHEYVPFHRLDAKYDEKDRLIEGTYWIKMPANETQLVFKFQEIYNTSTSYDWPYVDCYYSASASGSTYELVLKDEKYADAIEFCYYAKEQYFGSNSTRLMCSPYEDMWYRNRFYRLLPNAYDFSGALVMSRNLTRGDMVKCLRRISQVRKFDDDDDWMLYATSGDNYVISRQPSRYIDIKSTRSNCPDAVASYYAGYPPKLGVLNFNNIYYPYDILNNTIIWTMYNRFARNDSIFYCSEYTADDNTTPNFAEITAGSDFLTTARDIPDYAWAAWAGVVGEPNGWISTNFNPCGMIDYKEAFTALWNYTKFRQLDIPTDPFYTPPSDLNEEFLSTPACRWALSNGFTTGYYAPFSHTTTMPSGVPIQVGTAVNRAEWAYAISKLCQDFIW